MVNIEFTTQIPVLSVMLDGGGVKTDPTTGAAIEGIPARFAEFKNGVFIAKTKEEAIALLKKFAYFVSQGITPSFTYSHRTADEAMKLAEENGIMLSAARLSAGDAPVRAYGESERSRSQKPGDERNSADVIRAEEVEAEQERKRVEAEQAAKATEVAPEPEKPTKKAAKATKPKPPVV